MHPVTSSSWRYCPGPTSWQRPEDEELLPRRLRNWFDPRNAALFVARALDATSKRTNWTPRKHIPRRKVRRVLNETERFLATGRDKHIETALKWWGMIPVATKRRQFVGAVGDLVYAVRRVHRTPPGLDPWERLDAAYSQVQLDKVTLDRIEMRVRLRDFTKGQEKRIDDPDVWMACAAACDIDNYEVAREIAQRAVEEGCP